MSTWDALEAMLATDPRDVGCGETFSLIHTYAELAMRGVDPERGMPGIRAHLASCGPCADDYLGLLAALRSEAFEAQLPWVGSVGQVDVGPFPPADSPRL